MNDKQYLIQVKANCWLFWRKPTFFTVWASCLDGLMQNIIFENPRNNIEILVVRNVRTTDK